MREARGVRSGREFNKITIPGSRHIAEVNVNAVTGKVIGLEIEAPSKAAGVKQAQESERGEKGEAAVKKAKGEREDGKAIKNKGEKEEDEEKGEKEDK